MQTDDIVPSIVIPNLSPSISAFTVPSQLISLCIQLWQYFKRQSHRSPSARDAVASSTEQTQTGKWSWCDSSSVTRLLCLGGVLLRGQGLTTLRIGWGGKKEALWEHNGVGLFVCVCDTRVRVCRFSVCACECWCKHTCAMACVRRSEDNLGSPTFHLVWVGVSSSPLHTPVWLACKLLESCLLCLLSHSQNTGVTDAHCCFCLSVDAGVLNSGPHALSNTCFFYSATSLTLMLD